MPWGVGDHDRNHKLIQDKKAEGSYKSEYHCAKCDQQWAYYDQGDFERSRKYINGQWSCEGRNNVKKQ